MNRRKKTEVQEPSEFHKTSFGQYYREWIFQNLNWFNSFLPWADSMFVRTIIKRLPPSFQRKRLLFLCCPILVWANGRRPRSEDGGGNCFSTSVDQAAHGGTSLFLLFQEKAKVGKANSRSYFSTTKNRSFVRIFVAQLLAIFNDLTLVWLILNLYYLYSSIG